jgi:soluble lytic murein transglycosylase-like protein
LASHIHLHALRPAPYFPCQILLLAILFIFPALWSPPVHADVYGYMDKDGFLRFVPAGAGAGSGNQGALANLGSCSAAVEGIIHRAASHFKVEPCLVKAMIKVESDFDQRAVSQKGAMGLMQLMPQTAQDMDVKDPFNPTENIQGGTRYLSLLLDRFKYNLWLTLAAYNAGPEKVEAYGGIPPIEETQAYVRRVLSVYKLYKGNGLSRHGKETEVPRLGSEMIEPRGPGENS